MVEKSSIGIGVIGSIVVILLLVPWSESAIPPTPAFKFFNTTSGADNVTAVTYQDYIRFIAGSGMTITPNNSTRSVTFSVTSSESSVYENNTASNVGTGEASIFKQKSGVDLQFKKLKAGTNISFINGTDDITISASGGASGEANTASNVGSGALKLFHSKSGVDLRFKSLTSGQGITVTNGTDTGTIATSFKIDTLSTIATDAFVSGFNNSTGDWTIKTFSVNTQTCSGNDKVSAINNVTGEVTCSTDQTGSGGGPTVLNADVVCSSVSPSYCTIFTIPLTASSGNAVDVYLVADSNTAGVAIQTRVRSDQAATTGFCTHRVYTTATAEVLDVLAITTTAADTGETVWLAGANVPMPLRIQCAAETGVTPGNLIVEVQMETTGTGTIQKGSYYVKTP